MTGVQTCALPIYGEPLHTCTLRYGADRRRRGAELVVQFERRHGYPSPRLVLLFGPFLEFVLPACHGFSIQRCALIVDNDGPVRYFP